MPYPKLQAPVETELYKVISKEFGDISALRKVFLFAKQATSELGIYTPARYFDGVLTLCFPRPLVCGPHLELCPFRGRNSQDGEEGREGVSSASDGEGGRFIGTRN